MSNDNLPQTVKENVFVRIINWFSKKFKKASNTQYSNTKNIKSDEFESKSLLDSIKVDDKSEIILLQQKLKKNEITISDLTDTQLQQMIELYKNQIEQKKIKLKRYRNIISKQEV